MKKAYSDHRGLTLVELLLGVAILGLVVAPLLHAFVTGAGTETRGRKYGDATAAAQSLMETIQAARAGDDFARELRSSLGGEYYTPVTAGGFTPADQDKPQASNGKYYIGVENYEGYDLMVTVDSSAGINSEMVPVSNAMDLMVDMTRADEAAKVVFDLEMAGFTDANKISFSRTGVTITARDGGDGGSYEIDIAFNYSGSFSYRDEDGKDAVRGFSHQETASAGAAAPEAYVSGRPAFSLFLFLKAEGMAEQVKVLNNITWEGKKADFNLFLVYSGNDLKSLKPRVEYRPQNDKSEARVFSNVRLDYYACYESGWGEPMPDGGSRLVETEVYDRFYNVTISLYERGGGFASESLLTELEGVKLD